VAAERSGLLGSLKRGSPGEGEALPDRGDAAARGPEGGEAPRAGYGRGARVLSVGIASTGVVTFAYFSIASHVLGEVDYKGISLLWSVMFLIISIIYRPVEQLLSHTISVRRAHGLSHGHPLRVPVAIQATFALVFLAAALGAREPIQQDVFDGSAALYWVLVVGVLAYGASYFARGWLAGHERFELYGGLVLLEALSRLMFALAVALGIAEGQNVVALGICAAPLVSLVVVPVALRRRTARHTAADALTAEAAAEGEPGAPGDLSLRRGTRFAAAVLAIMAAEQALLNGPVVAVDATSADAALAGFVFNVLLIARAPLQLFQAVQTSLLPHLSGLAVTEGGHAFDRAVRITVAAIAGFTALVALGLLAVGPLAMSLLFGGDFDYGRGGLVLMGLGMGFHLMAGTFNQAALARGRAAWAAAAWLGAAVLFLGWLALGAFGDPLLRVEIGYCATTAVLAGVLYALNRR
jgi:O-antigen/teichoic acid export membrane protein